MRRARLFRRPAVSASQHFIAKPAHECLLRLSPHEYGCSVDGISTPSCRWKKQQLGPLSTPDRPALVIIEIYIESTSGHDTAQSQILLSTRRLSLFYSLRTPLGHAHQSDRTIGQVSWRLDRDLLSLYPFLFRIIFPAWLDGGLGQSVKGGSSGHAAPTGVPLPPRPMLTFAQQGTASQLAG